jgi:DNA-directed RNA polymerase specialized sigma24 family protein
MGPPIDIVVRHNARVRALPLRQIGAYLVAKLRYRGVSAARAEDLVQLAFERLIAVGADSWDPVADPEAKAFLLREIGDIKSKERKRAERRRTDLDSDAVEQAPPSSDRGPERLVVDRDRAEWAQRELLRRLEAWPVAREIALICIEEGKRTPAEVAPRLGLDMETVYEAYRILHEQVREVSSLERRNEARLEAPT